MNKTKSFVIGVDLGGTNVAAGLVNSSGQVLQTTKKSTKAHKSPEVILERLMNAVEAAAVGQKWDRIAAIGIGSPGPLDPDTGVIFDTPNLTLKNVPLGPTVSARFGVPVFVDNDVNVGTLGEYIYGAGRGYKNVVGIFVGTGIGGGLILDGRLWHGTSKNAGEVGHIILDPAGPLCGCGSRGCLEAFASRKSIVRDLALAIQNGKKSKITDWLDEKKDLMKVRSKFIAKAYAMNDPLVVEVIDKAAGYIGLAIKNLVYILGADLFILGGGVVEALGESFLKPVREQLTSCLPGTAVGLQVRLSELGDQAGILGAAALAQLRMADESSK